MMDLTLQALQAAFPETDQKMPVLFTGHGSPMNAIEENEFSQAWRQMGQALPRPKVILCVSAHWETPGSWVTAMPQPKTIHDFGGFPRELYEKSYPAPGSPELAEFTRQTVGGSQIGLDQSWGLDHGAWSVLCQMFPAADIPVIQLSLDEGRTPADHYALAQGLRGLRRRGVLILGSGNIVHNLRLMAFQNKAYDWALEFDEIVRQRILAGDHAALIQYQQFGPVAARSIPTQEHYLPLLYVLAQQEPDDRVRFFTEQMALASISMRSVWIG